MTPKLENGRLAKMKILEMSQIRKERWIQALWRYPIDLRESERAMHGMYPYGKVQKETGK